MSTELTEELLLRTHNQPSPPGFSGRIGGAVLVWHGVGLAGSTVDGAVQGRS